MPLHSNYEAEHKNTFYKQSRINVSDWGQMNLKPV